MATYNYILCSIENVCIESLGQNGRHVTDANKYKSLLLVQDTIVLRSYEALAMFVVDYISSLVSWTSKRLSKCSITIMVIMNNLLS
jgi:hypothetical protein